MSLGYDNYDKTKKPVIDLLKIPLNSIAVLRIHVTIES